MKLCPTCRLCYEDTETVCATEEHGALVPSRPGTRIVADKYRLDRQLGRGGMGAVYVGTHIELERAAAIKLLLPDLVADPQSLERFRREARAAARLNHPNVADTYDYGILPGGEAYIVMELVNGQTLREYLNVAVALDCGEAAAIARQVADGIEVAHRNGIIHRDLKPSNIIISRDHHGIMQAKVVDFGIAKLKEYSSSGGTGVLTSTGSLVGTPRYMSPEQCAGHEIEEASDIYSLGVILYEMLAGHPPFDAASATAIAIKHVQEPPPPLQEQRADVPAALAALVMQSLAKDPDDRPQSAAELARGLRPFETPLAIGDAGDAGDETTHVAPRTRVTHGASDTEANRFPHADTSAGINHETAPTAPPDAQSTNRAGTPTLVTANAPSAIESENDPAQALSVQENSSLQPPVVTSTGEPENGQDAIASSPSSPRPATGAATGVASVAIPVNSADASSTPAAMSSSSTFADKPVPDGGSVAAAPHSQDARVQLKSVLPTLLIYAGIAFLVVIGLGALYLSSGRKSTRVANDAATGVTNAPVNSAQSNQQPMPAPTSDARPAAVESPAPPNVAQTSPEAERRALRSALDGWIAATNSRDIERQMSFYVPQLETYYLSNNVPRTSVRRDKSAAFGQARAVSINVADPVINVRPDGRTASMTFRKQYVIEGGAAAGSGEVVQELLWRKTDGGWKIVGERDRQVIR